MIQLQRFDNFVEKNQVNVHWKQNENLLLPVKYDFFKRRRTFRETCFHNHNHDNFPKQTLEMEKLAMLLDRRDQHHQNICNTRSNIQIQRNPNQNPSNSSETEKDDEKVHLEAQESMNYNQSYPEEWKPESQLQTSEHMRGQLSSKQSEHQKEAHTCIANQSSIRELKTTQGKSLVSSGNTLGTTGQQPTELKSKTPNYHLIKKKISSKCIKDLNLHPETIKRLEGNHRKHSPR